ncbi:hypothetical protein N0B21_20350 [Bacillus velezensis]|uniref:hypothetical protein n=1 Tax=Bacillus velezensis TaxID=492670 RepID=UPI0021B0B520|nr:hypothetical protein [Bacillus velezensis]MCT6684534.1 hypothetical protein [Bacillus velezensis]
MSEFKGHTLDKVQAAVLDKVIECMEHLHEKIEEEGGAMPLDIGAWLKLAI